MCAVFGGGPASMLQCIQNKIILKATLEVASLLLFLVSEESGANV